MIKRIINIIVVLLLFGVWATSCKTAAREERYYERQEKKLAAEEQKVYDNRVKAHQNMQSRETQKMMRAAERNSRQLNKSRRR